MHQEFDEEGIDVGHKNDHAAYLDEVGDENVDDEDGSYIIIMHLQHMNIGKYKHVLTPIRYSVCGTRFQFLA